MTEEHAHGFWRLSLLNDTYRKRAMHIYINGLGVCSKCRWRHGCFDCNFDKAVNQYMRKQEREEQQAMSEQQGQEEQQAAQEVRRNNDTKRRRATQQKLRKNVY